MTALPVEIRRAGADDAETFASLSAAAMADLAGRRWTAGDFEEILSDPNTIGLVAMSSDLVQKPVGYAVIRPAADEAELLSVAVLMAWRREGIARALVAKGARLAEVAGAKTMFLDVAEDNHGALRLYHAAGFTEIARRPNYYGRDGGKASVAAVVMRAALPLGFGGTI